MTGDANPALGKLLEVTGLQRCAHRAELLSELRAEERQVRLHATLARLHMAEGDVAHTELVGDLRRVGLGERSALHDERAQRLPQLQS